VTMNTAMASHSPFHVGRRYLMSIAYKG
jgi:hypothetical protein